MIPVSVLIAMLSSVVGLIVSYQADLPTGPAIVLAAGCFYVVSMLVGRRGGLVYRLVRARHLEA
jgi:zinc/manganese transport system permease protein